MGSSLSFLETEINPDRTYVVTGGNSGIGYEVAKNIARMGGHVIIACRNLTKAETAIVQMQKDYELDYKKKMATELEANKRDPKKLNIEIMELDLASFASTMRFIETFKERKYKLSVLICNAGLAAHSKVITEDGHELMLQANYLSHLLIILHFLPILIQSGDDCRIVQTSSILHNMGSTAIDNINGEKNWNDITFYCNSKLYQIMSMCWLTRHMKNTVVKIYSCHPGIVQTQMTETSSHFYVRHFVKTFFSKSSFDGAKTIIKAAADPSLKDETGIYMADCSIKSPSTTSRDENHQDKLMKYSLEALSKYLPAEIKDIIDF